MGTQTSPSTKTLSGHVIIDDANDRLYVNDDNLNPIALLGKDSLGGIVIKVAKPGQNVLSAPDSELVFNSSQNVFKIVDNNSVTVTIPSGYAAGTYDNSVSFSARSNTPMVLAAVIPPYTVSSDRYNLPLPAISAVSGSVQWLAYSTVGLNYVDFTVDLQVAGLSYLVGDWNFAYYILEETVG